MGGTCHSAIKGCPGTRGYSAVAIAGPVEARQHLELYAFITPDFRNDSGIATDDPLIQFWIEIA
jgi:hypothetical protein